MNCFTTTLVLAALLGSAQALNLRARDAGILEDAEAGWEEQGHGGSFAPTGKRRSDWYILPAWMRSPAPAYKAPDAATSTKTAAASKYDPMSMAKEPETYEQKMAMGKHFKIGSDGKMEEMTAAAPATATQLYKSTATAAAPAVVTGGAVAPYTAAGTAATATTTKKCASPQVFNALLGCVDPVVPAVVPAAAVKGGLRFKATAATQADGATQAQADGTVATPATAGSAAIPAGTVDVNPTKTTDDVHAKNDGATQAQAAGTVATPATAGSAAIPAGTVDVNQTKTKDDVHAKSDGATQAPAPPLHVAANKKPCNGDVQKTWNGWDYCYTDAQKKAWDYVDDKTTPATAGGAAIPATAIATATPASTVSAADAVAKAEEVHDKAVQDVEAAFEAAKETNKAEFEKEMVRKETALRTLHEQQHAEEEKEQKSFEKRRQASKQAREEETEDVQKDIARQRVAFDKDEKIKEEELRTRHDTEKEAEDAEDKKFQKQRQANEKARAEDKGSFEEEKKGQMADFEKVAQAEQTQHDENQQKFHDNYQKSAAAASGGAASGGV